MHTFQARAAPPLGESIRPGAAAAELLQSAARGLGDVEQRPERTRREQRVTRPRQDARRPVAILAEPPHKCRLTDPCLAGDEDQPPPRGRADSVQRLAEHRQLTRPLEQPAGSLGLSSGRCLHGTSCAHPPSGEHTAQARRGKNGASGSRPAGDAAHAAGDPPTKGWPRQSPQPPGWSRGSGRRSAAVDVFVVEDEEVTGFVHVRAPPVALLSRRKLSSLSKSPTGRPLPELVLGTKLGSVRGTSDSTGAAPRPSRRSPCRTRRSTGPRRAGRRARRPRSPSAPIPPSPPGKSRCNGSCGRLELLVGGVDGHPAVATESRLADALGVVLVLHAAVLVRAALARARGAQALSGAHRGAGDRDCRWRAAQGARSRRSRPARRRIGGRAQRRAGARPRARAWRAGQD